MKAPDISYYRRMQAALYRMQDGRVSADAFRTSGCPGCNRPFYNERATGPIYNYPRELREEEYNVALDQGQ
jgi:biotin synthase-related radical SAM superfamily protein